MFDSEIWNLEPKRYFQESVFVRKKSSPLFLSAFCRFVEMSIINLCGREERWERVNNMLLMPNIVSLHFQLRGKKICRKISEKNPLKVNREMVTTFFSLKKLLLYCR